MNTTMSKRIHPTPQFVPVALIRLALFLLPAVLLFVTALRNDGVSEQVFLLGAGFQCLICLLGLLTRTFIRQPLSSTILMVYGLAFAWLFVSTPKHDWCFHLTQALLIIIPLTLLGHQTFAETGAPTIRRAYLLARRLAGRKDWPRNLDKCRALPEVKALREALYLDATPALDLLKIERPPVQMAALSALEFRKYWQRGQAEIVLHLALRADEPGVRAAALSALANVEDRYIIEALAEFLRDPSALVRQAAMEALLWSTETRWIWIRHAVRRSLADPLCQRDGPLKHQGELLDPMAVEDLTAWASESGLVGMRAAASLAEHFMQAFQELPDPQLKRQVQRVVENPHAPAVLRLELAQMLKSLGFLDPRQAYRLLDHANPAPLRLLAAETLLEHEEDPLAIRTLRELARLPNREIAVATADVVQRQFRVQLGLVPGNPLPPLESREATEISRRVMAWAIEEEQAERERDNYPNNDVQNWEGEHPSASQWMET